MDGAQWGNLRALCHQHPLPEQDILQSLGTFHGEARLQAMTYVADHLKADASWPAIFEALKDKRDKAWSHRVGTINSFYYSGYDSVWAKVLSFPDSVDQYMMWKQRDLDELYIPFRTDSMSQRLAAAQDVIASMFSDEFIMWLPESCFIWHTHRDPWCVLDEQQRKSCFGTLWEPDSETIAFNMEFGDPDPSPDNDETQIEAIHRAFMGDDILDPKHALFLCPQYMIDGTDTNDPVLVGMDRKCMVVVWRE